MKKLTLLLFLLFISPGFLWSQSISGIVNTYTKVTAIDYTVSSATVSDVTGLNPCDAVFIVQMKGAAINETNSASFGEISNFNQAGNYERATIIRISGNTVFFKAKLLKIYAISGAVQLVKIARYASATVTAPLTAKAWDGNTGGIIALEVTNTLTLNADIDASGAGFRGGILNNSVTCTSNNMSNAFYALSDAVAGQKGEGIAEYIAGKEAGKGNQANGGGGGSCNNGGGAGGSNGGDGGSGGQGFNLVNNTNAVSGIGGKPMMYSTGINRIFMGGGGGSGQQDNAVGTPGTPGGGIIIITANMVTGTGAIRSNGSTQSTVAGSDGAGGAGAGGTILLSISGTVNIPIIQARGGVGGNNNNAPSGAPAVNTHCHAPGGGGGGGVIASNTTLSGTDVAGGAPGTIINTGSACFNTTYGATAGKAGQLINGLSIPEGNVIANPLQVSVLGQSTLCNGGSTTLTTISGTGYTYQWYFNNAPIPAATAVSYNATQPGDYQVAVITNCNTSYVSSVFKVALGTQPTPVITGETDICNGTSTVLSTGGGAGFTYQWQRNGQNITGATNSTYTAFSSGSYTVEVTGTGCNQPGVSPVHNLSLFNLPPAIITGSSVLCPSGRVVLQANAGVGYTYQWSRNFVNIPGATNRIYEATQTGSYRVTVTGCAGNSTSQEFLLRNYAPLSPFMITGNEAICTGESTLLTSGVVDAAYRYQWQFNGVDIPGATAASHRASQIGNYVVVITDECEQANSSAVFRVVGAARPVAAITGNKNVCPGKTNLLKATTGAGYRYRWEHEGRTIPRANAATYAATVAGNYRVIVYSCLDSAASAPFSFTTTPLPKPVISGSRILCGGSTVLRTDSIAGHSYQWFSQDVPIQNATQASLPVRQPGTYKVAVKDSCDNSATSQNFFVTPNTLNQIEISGKTIFCQEDTTVLSVMEDTNFTYQWQLNGLNISGATSASYKAYLPGNYSVRIANPCITLTSNSILLTMLPKPEATISGRSEICLGTSTILRVTKNTSYTYQWFEDGFPMEGAVSAEYAVVRTGTYHVMVTNGGCSIVSAPFRVTVVRFDESKVSVTRDTILCAGNSLTLKASGGISYEWQPATGLSNPQSANPVANPSVSTRYRVRITNSAGCFINREVFVQIVPAFTPDFSATVSSGCGAKAMIELTDRSTGVSNLHRYTWTMGDGTVYQGTLPPVHIYQFSGIYAVSLDIYNGVCTARKTQNIQVENLFVPNLITPNDDGKNDVLILDRPGTGWKVEIYNRLGQRVFSSNNYANDWGKDIKDGIYFYVATSPLGRQCRSKLQVIR